MKKSLARLQPCSDISRSLANSERIKSGAGGAAKARLGVKNLHSVFRRSSETVGLCPGRPHNGEKLPVSIGSPLASARAEVCRCIATCWPSYWPVAEDRVWSL